MNTLVLPEVTVLSIDSVAAFGSLW